MRERPVATMMLLSQFDRGRNGSNSIASCFSAKVSCNASHWPQVCLAAAMVEHVLFDNSTTLGYGDVVPVERWALLGTMAALDGAVLLGWPTAVIFEVLRQAMRSRDQRGEL